MWGWTYLASDPTRVFLSICHNLYVFKVCMHAERGVADLNHSALHFPSSIILASPTPHLIEPWHACDKHANLQLIIKNILRIQLTQYIII